MYKAGDDAPPALVYYRVSAGQSQLDITREFVT